MVNVKLNNESEKSDSVELDVESPLLKRISTTYGDKTKHNKMGEANVYYCRHCNIEHASKKRIEDHKKKCKVKL